MTLPELRAAVAAQNPMIPSETDGSLSCFWCNVSQDELDLLKDGRYGDHADDCLWKRCTDEIAGRMDLDTP